MLGCTGVGNKYRVYSNLLIMVVLRASVSPSLCPSLHGILLVFYVWTPTLFVDTVCYLPLSPLMIWLSV